MDDAAVVDALEEATARLRGVLDRLRAVGGPPDADALREAEAALARAQARLARLRQPGR